MESPPSPSGTPPTGVAIVRRRAACLAAFNRWEALQSSTLSAHDAIAGIGFLYDLLPLAARERPVRTEGVAIMQRLLALLPGRLA